MNEKHLKGASLWFNGLPLEGLSISFSPIVTIVDVIKAFKNTRAAERITEIKIEIDEQLDALSNAIQTEDQTAIQVATNKLQELHTESLQLEI